MTSLVDWFSRVCEEAQRSFITFQNPALDYDTRVVKGWPLVTLDSALYAVAAYLVMVAIGLSQIPAGWKPPAEKPAKGDWLTAFRKEPIRVFQAVYNLSQVHSRLVCHHAAVE